MQEFRGNRLNTVPGSIGGGRAFAGLGVDSNAMGFQQAVHALGLEVSQHQLNTLALQLAPQRAKGLGRGGIQAMHQPASSRC